MLRQLLLLLDTTLFSRAVARRIVRCANLRHHLQFELPPSDEMLTLSVRGKHQLCITTMTLAFGGEGRTTCMSGVQFKLQSKD